ncbi:helix-turn-helix domain-containing protein [Paenibacillus sp. YIM B09110]|uniref:helix-turn-helix domain-containing protein n=1 Tax=Paenibacillus sp. YIM B09110 TaxID=3126102 RepID=UPI00301E1C21
MNTKMTRVYRRFLISYLIVLLLPNIAGYLSYRVSIDVAQTSSIENSLLLLSQSSEMIEARLAEVTAFTNQLALDHDLDKLISGKKQEPEEYDVFNLWKTARDISTYSKTNDYLQHFYIYLSNNDAIIAPNVVYFRPRQFHQLHHYKEMEYDEWIEMLTKETHEHEIVSARPYITESKEISVLSYIQSLPLNSFREPKATLVVTIDKRKISTQLEKLAKLYGGWAYISNGEGEIIISEGIEAEEIGNLPHIPSGEEGDKTLLHNGNLLISSKSELLGWVYTASIPEKALQAKGDVIKNLTLTFTSITLVIGFSIILFFTYRNSKPLYKLIQVLKERFEIEPSDIRNEYDFLAGNITSLIANNERLQTELKDQLPLLRDAFIKKLLVGGMYSIEEIKAEAAQAAMMDIGHSGIVLIIQMNDYTGLDAKEFINELNVGRLLIKQSLRDLSPDALVTDWGTDKIAIIVQDASGNGDQQLRNELEISYTRFLEHIYEQYHLSIMISFGTVFREPNAVGQSFSDALITLEYAVQNGIKGISRYEYSVKDSDLYYYPIEIEQRLFHALKSGYEEESKRILVHILHRNFAERILTHETMQKLTGEISGTMYKLLDQQGVYDEQFVKRMKQALENINPMLGSKKLQDSFVLLAGELCDIVVKKKSDLNQEMIQTVIMQLENEYADSNLTLYRIGERIGRPEKYLSQLFKDITGDTISDYLERLRIDQASYLLTGSQLTIDEIAEQTGYNSSHSFRRAFKRVTGDSPSSFREKGRSG